MTEKGGSFTSPEIKKKKAVRHRFLNFFNNKKLTFTG